MDQNEQFQEVLNYYSSNKNDRSQETLIQLLHETQEIYQYIPNDIQQIIAERMDIKLSTITAIIKMIPSLKGEYFKNKITVCTGPRCSAKGGANILNAVEKELNIKSGGITKDGSFLFTTQNCLKKCGTSPNIKINDDIYNLVKPEDIPNIIKKYRK